MGFGSVLAKSIKGAFKPNKLGPIGGVVDAVKRKASGTTATTKVASPTPGPKKVSGGVSKVAAPPAGSFGKRRVS